MMQEFHFIDDVVFGSELYVFTTKFFLVRSKKNMWAAIRNMKRKFVWLKLMFERISNLESLGYVQSSYPS
jgi:hypothetical protein